MSNRSSPIHIDFVTVMLVFGIVLLGLVMVTSASISMATKEGGDAFGYLLRQFTLVIVGSAFAAVMFTIRTEWLEKMALPLLALAVVLLVLVLIPGIGHSVNGARRWIRLAGISIQVSEVTRVIVLVFIASYAVRREEELRSSFMGLLKPLIILGGFFVLLLLEPDFGAATVLMVTAFGVLFIAGARLRDVAGLAVLGAAVLVFVAMSSDYRMRRLTAFRNPWLDPFDSGFQLTQSLIAIGRGGWTGVGLGESVQKLFYLPEAHTDFLFAVLAEELGLVGILVTLALFLALAWRALWISRLAHDSGLKFQSYLAAGFGIWVGLQAFINIGVNMGVLPTKGLTLPLLSFGGSGIVANCLALAILLRVDYENRRLLRGFAV
jgi:cell division protein FtsW